MSRTNSPGFFPPKCYVTRIDSRLLLDTCLDAACRVGRTKGAGGICSPDFCRSVGTIQTVGGGGHCALNRVLRGHFLGIKMLQ